MSIALNENKSLLWNPRGENERLKIISESVAGVPFKDQSLSINASAQRLQKGSDASAVRNGIARGTRWGGMDAEGRARKLYIKKTTSNLSPK